MNRSIFCVIFAALFLGATPTFAQTTGPAKGSLVIVGGGGLPKPIRDKFVELAGGPDSQFIVIPTANEDEIDLPKEEARFATMFGVKHVTVIHTRDPKIANTEEFVKPIKSASAVWFDGGRQWRITDAFLGTRTEKEIRAVLDRGGVIGGSSAGATIQGSYLVRGSTTENTTMMSKGHEIGFGYVKNAAIDQHIISRKREGDLVPVVKAHPELLGIGIDEATAVIVKGDTFEIMGRSKVAITDGADHDGKPYFLLSVGDKFNLKERKVITPATKPTGAP